MKKKTYLTEKVREYDLIREIAEDSNLTIKQTEDFITAFKNVVIKNLKKEKPVYLIGFGKFEVFKRKERKGVNPWEAQKGNLVIEDRKAVRVPKFRSGYKLKRMVK